MLRASERLVRMYCIAQRGRVPTAPGTRKVKVARATDVIGRYQCQARSTHTRFTPFTPEHRTNQTGACICVTGCLVMDRFAGCISLRPENTYMEVPGSLVTMLMA